MVNKNIRNTILLTGIVACVLQFYSSCNHSTQNAQNSRENTKKVSVRTERKKSGRDIVRKRATHDEIIVSHEKVGNDELEITQVRKKDGGYIRTVKFAGKGEYRAETNLVDGNQKLSHVVRISADGSNKTFTPEEARLRNLRDGKAIGFRKNGSIYYATSTEEGSFSKVFDLDGGYFEESRTTDEYGPKANMRTVDSAGNEVAVTDNYKGSQGEDVEVKSEYGKITDTTIEAKGLKYQYHYENGISSGYSVEQETGEGQKVTQHYVYDGQGNAVLESYDISKPPSTFVQPDGKVIILPSETFRYNPDGTLQEDGASNKQQITPEEMMALIRQARKNHNG